MSLLKAIFHRHKAINVNPKIETVRAQQPVVTVDDNGKDVVWLPRHDTELVKARAFLESQGIKDVLPLIKVSRKRKAKIKVF